MDKLLNESIFKYNWIIIYQFQRSSSNIRRQFLISRWPEQIDIDVPYIIHNCTVIIY